MSDVEVYRSLYIGNLSCFCTEEEIFRTFQHLGPIEGIKVVKGKENSSLGYGFITFQNQQAALRAFHMEGFMLLGRPLKIAWSSGCSNPNQFTKAKPSSTKPTVAQIHFSFLTRDNISGVMVTEPVVREIFSLFGEIHEIHFKKIVLDQNRQQSGYGFIDFPLTRKGVESAIHACNAINQVVIKNVLYDCSLTHSFEQYIKKNYPEFPLPAPHPVIGSKVFSNQLSNPNKEDIPPSNRPRVRFTLPTPELPECNPVYNKDPTSAFFINSNNYGNIGPSSISKNVQSMKPSLGDHMMYPVSHPPYPSNHLLHSFSCPSSESRSSKEILFHPPYEGHCFSF